MRAADSEKPRRGRPPTGEPMSSTHRNQVRRERLAREGCRLLGSVVLTPDAAAALDRLTADGRTISDAICAALLAAEHP